ncbi:MAG: FAD-dependent oxidoreductase [Lachnospiraceae bacterium]|nr:FAD-dependent oxidoreductase [Robinsoniella sp.]MDY3765088.1 FAD-dependent oxidoreductase [Lachnospiraceae bacterium]
MENLIIVGSGPAGVSASLYTVRANLSPLVIANGMGGLEKADKIENFYGNEEGLNGAQLHEKGIRQAKNLGVRFLEAEVLGIREEENFVVVTSKGEIEAKMVLLATGAKRTTLKIPGRKELEGRGISYCAICDAFFYRRKKVAVVGNGDFALHEARVLKPLAESVVLLTDGELQKFSESPEFAVETRKLAAFEGTEKLEAIRFIDGQKMDVDGVFLAIGTAGSGEIARQMGAQLTQGGQIKVNEEMETTIKGLYAAGDCTGGILQVAKAVYEGAAAGMAISKAFRKIQ